MAPDLCYNIVFRCYLEHLQTNLLQTLLRSSYLEDVVWYCRLMPCFCTKLNLRGGVSCMPAALLFTMCYHFYRGKSYHSLIKKMIVPFVCICLRFFYEFNSVDRTVLLFISSKHGLVRTPTLVSEHNLY